VADRFGGMPVKPEMASGDREIGGHSQFFAWARGEQRTIIADAKAEVTSAHGCPAANLPD
jgi:hypothetical protein